MSGYDELLAKAQALDDSKPDDGLMPYELNPPKIVRSTEPECAENGLYYPEPKDIKDPDKVRNHVNNLRRDVLTLMKEFPGIHVDKIRQTLSQRKEHKFFFEDSKYRRMFEMYTKPKMDRPYYLQLLNRYADEVKKIKENKTNPHLSDLKMKLVREEFENQFKAVAKELYEKQNQTQQTIQEEHEEVDIEEIEEID